MCVGVWVWVYGWVSGSVGRVSWAHMVKIELGGPRDWCIRLGVQLPLWQGSAAAQHMRSASCSNPPSPRSCFSPSLRLLAGKQASPGLASQLRYPSLPCPCLLPPCLTLLQPQQVVCQRARHSGRLPLRLLRLRGCPALRHQQPHSDGTGAGGHHEGVGEWVGGS